MGVAYGYKVRVPWTGDAPEALVAYATACAFECIVTTAAIPRFFNELKSFKCKTEAISVEMEFVFHRGQPFLVSELPLGDAKRFRTQMDPFIAFVDYACKVPATDTPSFFASIFDTWQLLPWGIFECGDASATGSAASGDTPAPGVTELLALAEPAGSRKSPPVAPPATTNGASAAGPSREGPVAPQKTPDFPEPPYARKVVRLTSGLQTLDRPGVAERARPNTAHKAKATPRVRESEWVAKIKEVTKVQAGAHPPVDALWRLASAGALDRTVEVQAD